MSKMMDTYARQPVTFEKGEGVWLWAKDGKKYLDALSGVAVNGLGHTHPKLIKAINEQISRLIHVSNVYHIAEQEKLAEKLLTHRSSSHQAYYVKSVYLESKGDLVGARDQMLTAHDLDPLNPIYILSLGIFELNLGNLEKAKMYAQKVRILNPDQQGLILLEQAIGQK